ncbi:MAG: hypothetical protein IPH84_08615 [Bacteroidales bacterium]|nr:hypothetical protein [Bacteroidales bacterium]
MSVVFLVAATGFSYSTHYCHGDLTDVFIYPGLTQSSPSCGCAIEQMNSSQQESHSGISKSTCCKNLHYFQKIQVLAFEKVNKVIGLSIHSILPVLLPGLLPVSLAVDDDSLFSYHKDRVPPLGISRVIMHHQLRIPSPLSDC